MMKNSRAIGARTAAATLLMSLTSMVAAGPPGETACPVGFRAYLIGRLPEAYQCAVADVNGDGKPDIIGLSSGRSEIAWYENPSWKKHLVTTATRRNIDIAAFDLDGDGKLEIAVASEFDLNNTREGGRLQWFKAAGPDAEWSGHEIANLPTAHRIRWVDWDGDGKKELVVVPIAGPGAAAPDYKGGVPITSYAFANGIARSRLVDRTLSLAHGVRVLDFDGDGRDDLLVASFEGVTLFQPHGKGASRSWTKTPLSSGEQGLPAPRRGSSEVDRGWLKGHKSFLATIEPWHGNEVVVYTPPSDGAGLWKRHVIDDTLQDGHALGCVDLDGDGQSEIVAGYRGGAHNLYGYRCIDTAGEKWERFIIDAGDMAGACLVIADLTGSGHPDIVASGSATGNLKWYENLGVVGRGARTVEARQGPAIPGIRPSLP